MNFKDKIKEIFHKIIDFFVYMFKDKPENVEEIISFTGENKISNLDSEKISYFSNILHKNDAKASEKIQSSLCYVVLGAIFAVIGIIFIFLSLRKRLNRIIGINFASVQFVVCVVCLILGAFLLTLGILKALNANKKRKSYRTYIGLLAKREKDLKEVNDSKLDK